MRVLMIKELEEKNIPHYTLLKVEIKELEDIAQDIIENIYSKNYTLHTIGEVNFEILPKSYDLHREVEEEELENTLMQELEDKSRIIITDARNKDYLITYILYAL